VAPGLGGPVSLHPKSKIDFRLDRHQPSGSSTNTSPRTEWRRAFCRRVLRFLAQAAEHTGVCGTDLALLSGNRVGQAEVLGHEGVGVVLYAPESCSVSKGARMIINPVHRKHPHIVIGHSRDGIFRELFCVDAADADDGLVSTGATRILGIVAGNFPYVS
jgi:hypothetical protein